VLVLHHQLALGSMPMIAIISVRHAALNPELIGAPANLVLEMAVHRPLHAWFADQQTWPQVVNQS
jgi:hypothetical protein